MSEERNRLLGTPFVTRAARWGIVAWASIGVLGLLFIFFRYVLFPIRIIFPPLVVALIFVYLLNPFVSWLKDRGVPRILGAVITYLVLLSAMGVGLRFLIPILVDQVEGFTRSLPRLLERAQETMADLLQRVGLEAETFTPESQQVLDVAERLLSLTRGLLNVALILLLGLILGFYLLVDLPKIRSGAIALVPARRRADIVAVFRKLGRAIGGFFRGQLLVALFVGVASMLALYIVGLPYWALVGMITGLFNLIPLIGPFIGGAIAVFVAFTTHTAGEGLLRLAPGWSLAVGGALGLLIVQQIDNHIISPNIVARTVKLHPVTVMLALLAGGALLGLWGMLLAVPVVASVKILILHVWDTQATWPPRSEGEPAGEVATGPPEPTRVEPAQVEPAQVEPAQAPRRERGRRGWLRRWRSQERPAAPAPVPPEPERVEPPRP